MMHVSSFPTSNQQWPYPDFWPTHRTVEAGDMVMTENPIGYGMYYTKIMATFFVGEPPKEYRDMFELAASTHDKVIRELKPGMTGHDVKKFVEPFEQAGYTTSGLLSGWSNYNHGPFVGVAGNFPRTPFGKPSDLDFVFKPGLCMQVNAYPIKLPEMKKGLWVGSTCLFTKDGLRELNKYPVSKLRVA